MKIYVEDDYQAMSAKAAQIFAKEHKKNPAGVFGFATGSTPIGLYDEIVKMGLDFSKLTAFNLDEYYPIRKSDDQSYDYFMKEHLFNRVNMDASRANIPNGEADEPEAEAERYEKQISESGGVDLQILGLGLNGHIGFNEPNDYFEEKVNCVALKESTVKANARFFASEEDVPKKAITMGVGTIMKSKKIILLASGEAKADIVKEVLNGKIRPQVPATILRMHRDAVVVLDKAAARLI